MRYHYFLILILLFSVGITQEVSAQVPLPDAEYWLGYPVHTYNLLISPLNWEEKEWFMAAGVGGATLTLFFFDEYLQEWVQSHRTEDMDKISGLVKPIGEWRNVLPGLVGFYLYGYVVEDDYGCETALIAIESLVVSGVFTQALKYSLQRHRPSVSSSARVFDGPLGPAGGGSLSFSSGHACVAFAVATVIAERYREIKWVPWVVYSLAGLTAFSRVHDNNHWASDSFFGSVLGYFTARGILALHEKKGDGGFNLFLRPDRGAIEFSFTF